MINPKHIIEGWGKSLGLFEVSKEEMDLSMARMKICGGCEFAKASSFLKIFRNDAKDLGSFVCSKCPSKIKCPVNEKTLVADEVCPENKW